MHAHLCFFYAYLRNNMAYERCACGASRFQVGGVGTWFRRAA